MKFRKIIQSTSTVMAFVLLLAACSSGADVKSTSTQTRESSVQESKVNKSSLDENIREVADEVIQQDAGKNSNKEESSITENDTGKTVICKASNDSMYNTTYMIISKNGTVVLTDPIEVLSGIKPDIITISHSHSDHYDRSAEEPEGCRISQYTVESFTVKDVKVKSVAAAHGTSFDEQFPDNIIYVFEVDGLRIAHMGDMGQDKLTDKQLKELGKLDIIFMPCVELPQYGLTVENSTKVIKQLKPKIVIPTHYDGCMEIDKVFDESAIEVFKFAISKDDMKNIKSKFIQLINY